MRNGLLLTLRIRKVDLGQARGDRRRTAQKQSGQRSPAKKGGREGFTPPRMGAVPAQGRYGQTAALSGPAATR